MSVVIHVSTLPFWAFRLDRRTRSNGNFRLAAMPTQTTPPAGDDQHVPAAEKPAERLRQDVSAYGRAAGLAYIGIGALVVMLIAGSVIDHVAGTAPVWTLICSLVGIVVGIAMIMRAGSRW